jgi:hypothetical protein
MYQPARRNKAPPWLIGRVATPIVNPDPLCVEAGVGGGKSTQQPLTDSCWELLDRTSL